MVIEIIKYVVLGLSIVLNVVLWILNYKKASKEERQQMITNILLAIPDLCTKAEQLFTGEKAGTQRSSWVQDQVKLLALEAGVSISSEAVQTEIESCINLKNIDRSEE